MMEPGPVERAAEALSAHEELDGALRDVRAAAAAWGLGEGLDPALVARFRRCLCDHFRHEEQQGFMAAILDQAPRFANRVRELQLEHVAMAREATDLERAVLNGEPGTGVRLAGLLARLDSHEASENDLLQRAFLRDSAAQD